MSKHTILEPNQVQGGAQPDDSGVDSEFSPPSRSTKQLTGMSKRLQHESNTTQSPAEPSHGSETQPKPKQSRFTDSGIEESLLRSSRSNSKALFVPNLDTPANTDSETEPTAPPTLLTASEDKITLLDQPNEELESDTDTELRFSDLEGNTDGEEAGLCSNFPEDLLSPNQHRVLQQPQPILTIPTTELVKLMVGYGRGVTQIYSQTEDMPTLEKMQFLQREKDFIEGSRTIRDKIIYKSLSKEIEQCEKEVKGYIKIFDNALQAGYASVNNINALIVGSAGVGKTCIKHLIFDLPPPEVRTSTPEEPVLTIRDIHKEKFQMKDTTWKPVKTNNLMQIVTETVSSIGLMVTNLPKNTKQQFEQIVETASNPSENPVSQTEPAAPTASPQHNPTPSSSPPEVIASAVANVQGKFFDAMSKAKGDPSSEDMEAASKVLGSNWIYFIDSGGQPHFHNLMPHFIQGMSIVLITLRLCDRLDTRPTIHYYDDGEPIGPSFESPLTIKDTLKSLIRSMQSLKIKPKLMFIGTFLDKIDECSETLDEKNQKLYDLFYPECLEQLIFSDSSMNKLIFPINATSRGEQEEAMARMIRSEIEKLRHPDSIVPIWWYVLEVILEILSLKLQRKVLSKQECLEVAKRLNFKEKELTAALTFFHKTHLLHYYPNILPNVIFTSPQILLDKLTELIKEAYRLRKPSGSTSTDHTEPKLGGYREFRDKGIITFALLNQFQQHYADGIFTVEDLLKILKELLILTPFSIAENDHTKSSFFMPSLLDMLPSSDLEKYRCFTELEPLVISFPTGSPRSGVFCCLQVHLIKEQKWELVTNNGKPEIIAQNCVMLSHPMIACNITLIDSFSYIEVHITDESKLEDVEKVLPQIREAILSGIRAANQALNYNIEQPHKTFFCFCSLASSSAEATATIASPSSSLPQRHIGKLKGNQLQCSLVQRKFLALDKRHTAWLGRTISNCASPSSSVLNVDEHILYVREAIHQTREKWLDIGRGLRIRDDDLTCIQQQYNDATECLYQMLKKWMNTGEASIKKLLEVLDSKVVGYSNLANELRNIDDPERRVQLGFHD